MGLAAPRSTPFQPPPATPLALVSTLRATASAFLKPSPCPQRASPLPLIWRRESGAACRAGGFGRRASLHRRVGQGFQPQKTGQGRGGSPAWPRREEPGAAVRVTQRAKEGRRAVGLGRWAVTRDCRGWPVGWGQGGWSEEGARTKSFAPPARWSGLSAAKGRAGVRKSTCLAAPGRARSRCARNAKGERRAAGSGAWKVGCYS